MYLPHRLQKQETQPTTKDADGNPIKSTPSWVELSPCRCDDNNTQRSIGVAGEAYIYQHKIVTPTIEALKETTEVRVIDADGQTVRAQGRVVRSVRMSYQPYTEMYL